MIRHTCCHSWGLGPEDSIFAAAERFVGPDQIVAGHADGKLGLQPSHRTGKVGAFRARCASHRRQSRLERSIYAVRRAFLFDPHPNPCPTARSHCQHDYRGPALKEPASPFENQAEIIQTGPAIIPEQYARVQIPEMPTANTGIPAVGPGTGS